MPIKDNLDLAGVPTTAACPPMPIIRAIPGPIRGEGFPSSMTLVPPAHRDGSISAVGAALHPHIGLPPGCGVD